MTAFVVLILGGLKKIKRKLILEPVQRVSRDVTAAIYSMLLFCSREDKEGLYPLMRRHHKNRGSSRVPAPVEQERVTNP